MTDPSSRATSAPVVIVSLLAIGLVGTVGWILLRQENELSRLESRLARLSGPEDRVRTSEEISALHAQIERQSARLHTLEQAGPPQTDDPEAVALWRVGWQAELASLRAELDSLRVNPSGSIPRPDGMEALRLDGFQLLPFTFPLRGNNSEVPSWSADQALGPPDTEGLGDFPTAWASKLPDGGIEWLEVRFGAAIAPEGILVVESYHPGAVVKVEAAGPGRGWSSIWSGKDPSTEEANELYVGFSRGFEVDAVRVTLDTRLVQGWNEIDAVGLVVGDETIWGSESSASSTFGAQ